MRGDDRNSRSCSLGRYILLGLAALLLILYVGLTIEFALRMNSCEPGDHVIQSEADAIEVAKKKMVRDPRFSSESFGSAPDFVDDLNDTDDCCSAVKTINYSFVVEWEVRLLAQTTARPQQRIAVVRLSNCGSRIFRGSVKHAE